MSVKLGKYIDRIHYMTQCNETAFLSIEDSSEHGIEDLIKDMIWEIVDAVGPLSSGGKRNYHTATPIKHKTPFICFLLILE